MKRVLLAIFLMAFVIGICIYENSRIDECYYQARACIEKMNTEFENKNYKEAESTARKLEGIWEKTEHELFYVTNTDSLNVLGTTISKLPLLAKEKSEEFLSESRVAEVMLEHLVDRKRYYIY